MLHFSPIDSETRQNSAYFGKVSSKLKGAFLRSQKTSFCVGVLRGRDFLITNRWRISTKSLVQNFRTFRPLFEKLVVTLPRIIGEFLYVSRWNQLWLDERQGFQNKANANIYIIFIFKLFINAMSLN